jgi:cob(I)alamin adenosyltransferase
VTSDENEGLLLSSEKQDGIRAIFMTKIYTRTGDDGTTGLLGSQRVQKHALRVEAFGALDECNAAIGIARSGLAEVDVDKILENVQSLLFSAAADLACAVETEKIERVRAEDISQLEKVIDRLENELTPLKAFILPGGAAMSAHIHLARSICRRAERNIVRLSRSELINPLVLVAVNRISDLLFVVARVLNSRSGAHDTIWNKERWNS